MKYAHVISKLTSTPWLATPEVMESIARLINGRLSGVSVEPRVCMDQQQAAQMEPSEPYDNEDGVAVIEICGVIGKRLSSMETMCGGVDVDTIREAFDTAMLDGAVKSVLLYIDSPGGSVTGVPELAAHISNTKVKPVVAYTDTMAASGGYYIAAAADAIYASETAQLGSIGAIIRIVDRSTALERAGLRVYTFKSGEFKDLGDGLRPLTESEQAIFQAQIDAIGARFRADVKGNRPLIKDEFMQAQVMNGIEAAAAKLTDGIYNTQDEVIALMRGAN